jgi:RNA polymerase primary sigma factor
MDDVVADAPAEPLNLHQYLHEIGRIPLLTADQEVALARRIQAGIREQEQATQEHRPVHTRVVQDGLRARKHLIEANLRLVVSLARNYDGPGLSQDDLIQEGNLGLMQAVEHFDPARERRFSTYAVWWIRQAITRALRNKARLIRLPEYLDLRAAAYRQTRQHLEMALERQATLEEIAAAMEHAPNEIRDLLAAYQGIASLETFIGEDGDGTLREILPDPSSPSDPSQMLIAQDLEAALRTAIETELTAREREYVQLRFGLFGKEPLTLEAVGARMGISKQRVQQLERATLNKLVQQQELREFL